MSDESMFNFVGKLLLVMLLPFAFVGSVLAREPEKFWDTFKGAWSQTNDR